MFVLRYAWNDSLKLNQSKKDDQKAAKEKRLNGTETIRKQKVSKANTVALDRDAQWNMVEPLAL